MSDEDGAATSEQVPRLYDLVATKYAATFATREIFDLEEPYVDRLRCLSVADEPRIMLDVGCGPALYYTLANRFDIEYVGIDRSENMLREGVRIGARGRVAQADAQKLPIRDGSVSMAVAMGSVSHIDYSVLMVVLSEIARVLRVGGGFLFGDQLGSSTADVQFPLATTHLVTVFRRTQAEYEAMLRESGFTVLKREVRTALHGEMPMDKILLWARLARRQA